MNKIYIALVLILIGKSSFALDVPATDKFEIKSINDKNILYLEHKQENGHPSNTLIKLVQYYLLNDDDDYQVIFPQFSFIQGDKEFYAIEYSGNADEKDGIKIKNVKGGKFYSYVYKGSYKNLPNIIPEVIYRINTETSYRPHSSEEIRLLYWNSIDDNHPGDLITEIQVRVVEK